MTHTDDTQPTTAHTPAPWKAFGTKIKYLFDNGLTETIADVRGGSFGQDDTAHANARRICAAVNACEGISTEALENGVVKQLPASSIKFSEALRTNYSDAQLCLEERDAWRDAIEKATGRAA